MVHGFTYTDYLTELGYADMTCGSPLGCPTDIIYFKSSTDTAVANAYHNAKGLLMNMGYSEDAAISMLSVACDFGMTQASSILRAAPLQPRAGASRIRECLADAPRALRRPITGRRWELGRARCAQARCWLPAAAKHATRTHL